MNIEISNMPALQPISSPTILRAINHGIDKLFIICLVIFFIVLGNTIKIEETYIIFLLEYLIISFLYYFISEIFLRRTPAKFFTQTQVTNENCSRINAKSCFYRTICRAIPFDDFSIFFMNGRTFHDKFSSTFVVKSSCLPESERPSKIVNITFISITCMLFILPFTILLFWVLYEQFTGGERLYIPNNIPKDLKVINAEDITDKNGVNYQVVTYKGNNDRVLKFSWQIAGFNFDPKQLCTNMTPTRDAGLGFKEINSAAECTVIAKNQDSKYWNSMIKTGPKTLVKNNEIDLSDFTLVKPPYRLAIKVESGVITEEEISEMYKGEYSLLTIPVLIKTINQ